MTVRRRAASLGRAAVRPLTRALDRRFAQRPDHHALLLHAVEVDGRLAAAEERTRDLEARLHDLRAVVAAADARLAERTSLLERGLGAVAHGAFAEHLGRPDDEDPLLVSVVVPSRNRSALAARAVASVLAQRWPLEVLLVDDGTADEDRADAELPPDPRVRVLRTSGGLGVSAARNLGLDEAKGEVIAYLDDDNVMAPGWLTAVASAFDARADVDVLYGAFVVDDPSRVDGRSTDDGAGPVVVLHLWSDAALAETNVADISAVAHRGGLEARFDESLREMADWDLLAQLTQHRPPLVLPVLACLYTTSAPGRLTGGDTWLADRDAVLRRWSGHGRRT